METLTAKFVRILTERHRVVVLGGLAVIAHGLSRSTYDGDIWLDPMEDCGQWAKAIQDACGAFTGLSLHRLPGWKKVSGSGLVEAVEDTGMVRVQGLDCPLDIFRSPNEFEAGDFDMVCNRARMRADGTLLPHPVDLIQTKIDTGRDKDRMDIFHLESLIRAEYRERLPVADAGEAREMLERYSDWEVLSVAMNHPAPEIRELAMEHLREFAAEGDPFSQAILAGRPIPGT
ncbi:MAG: hypothetical protein J0M04_13940 [Verrucomicrobia bacterium]|nr:hypothetical protein [Verrucomicrobiota bacterium]